jgi:hypothetical protein
MKPEKAYSLDFELGYGYDWCSNHTTHLIDQDKIASWLEDEIQMAEGEGSTRIVLPVNPHKQNGRYHMGDLKNEQRNVALKVISKVKEWCECRGNSEKNKRICSTTIDYSGQSWDGQDNPHSYSTSSHSHQKFIPNK